MGATLILDNKINRVAIAETCKRQSSGTDNTSRSLKA
ncbi:hypothetical protein PanWU01x14_188250 [Parasponia andersonii]|uniref:Uncharacterized protein n=1 Tax=Parasponia andersonii TaxID=3476 RepID=A0A2P5C359_PARAD|nr:hypothetical protein PanWU01x14_188250 [Parasponia andersonii]